MASVKEYAYYIEGNKVGIVERDTAFDNNVDSKEYGPGVSRAMWKSPKTSVADGLEIKYAHSPNYFITSTNNIHSTISNYKSASSGGYLKVKGGSVNYDTTLDVGDYIVLRNAGKFNGLHKITAFEDAAATKDSIVFSTKYSGSSSWSAFEETVTMYYSVNVLNDEADTIDIPSYLEKALVYYVKGRLAEDSGNIEIKEYMMREYKKHIETYESSLMKGPRIISSGFHAIR